MGHLEHESYGLRVCLVHKGEWRGREEGGGGDLTIYIYIIFVNLRGRKRGDFNGGERTNILFILLKSFTLQFM